MNILSKWLREYLPALEVSDRQLAEDLTLRGIAVEGVHALPDGGHRHEEGADPRRSERTCGPSSTCGDDDGVRALRGSLLENADCLGVGGGGRAAGEGVRAHAGGVGASDTLAGDVVVVGLLQAVAGGWADGGTLRVCKSRSWDVTPGILSMISNSPCCRSQWNRGRR